MQKITGLNFVFRKYEHNRERPVEILVWHYDQKHAIKNIGYLEIRIT